MNWEAKLENNPELLGEYFLILSQQFNRIQKLEMVSYFLA